mgnify:CR=1 FL=1
MDPWVTYKSLSDTQSLLIFLWLKLIKTLEDRFEYSKKYHVLFTRMKEFDWINQYQFHYGMTKALISVGKRISFENDLINAPDVFLKHESIIESTFEKFIKDAIPYFSNELTILRHAE